MNEIIIKYKMISKRISISRQDLDNIDIDKVVDKQTCLVIEYTHKIIKEKLKERSLDGDIVLNFSGIANRMIYHFMDKDNDKIPLVDFTINKINTKEFIGVEILHD